MDTTLDWVTLGVAVYAAFIATSVSIWTGIGIRRDRTAIKVQVRFGHVSSSIRGSWVMKSPNYDPARTDETTRLIVEAMNVGRSQLP